MIAAQTLARAAAAPRLRIVLLALLLALLASTQFLFQPFVWRNWPLDEVLLGWFDVAGWFALVALTISAAVLGALNLIDRLPRAHRAWRALLFATFVIAGAVVGELIVGAVSASGAGTWAETGERALHWSVITLSISSLRLAWLRALNAGTTMRRVQQARLDIDGQLTAVRLQALQAQIEPHFLFNTLATVRRLGATEPAQCIALLAHLNDFIRLSHAAQPRRQVWRVSDEIGLARAYLSVVELRMDGRLAVRFEIDPAALECSAPPLALSTLVENAVKHGIAPATIGGVIVIGAHRQGGRLVLRVADTGVGFGSASGGSGIGLANTRARLRTLYGADAWLGLAANQPRGVVATLEMPARLEAA